MPITIKVKDPWEVWGQSLRSRLPGADQSGILMELENTVCEFCKTSLCLAYEMPMTMQADVSKYPIDPVLSQPDPLGAGWSGVHAIYVHFAVFGGDPRRHFPRDHYPGQVQRNPGTPIAIWVPDPQVVELVPTPSESGKEFTVRTSLIPLRPLLSVPEMLSDYYFEPILDGTAGRMMGHVKRPYSDPRLAEYYTRRYRNGMRVAKDETLRRWGNAERSFTYNPDWSWVPPLRHVR